MTNTNDHDDGWINLNPGEGEIPVEPPAPFLEGNPEFDAQLKAIYRTKKKRDWQTPAAYGLIAGCMITSLFVLPGDNYGHWVCWGLAIIVIWFLIGPNQMEHFNGG